MLEMDDANPPTSNRVNSPTKPVQLPNELIAQIIAIRIDTDLTESSEPPFNEVIDMDSNGNLIREPPINEDASPKCTYCQEHHPSFCHTILEVFPAFRAQITSLVKQHHQRLSKECRELILRRLRHWMGCKNWDYDGSPWLKSADKCDDATPCETCDRIRSGEEKNASICKKYVGKLVKCLVLCSGQRILSPDCYY